MLLRSDLGIMDVAWGRKEKHKSNLKDLTRSRLNEIRRLDEQFTGIRGIPVSLEEPASP
jgi:hypothetical protein